MNFKCKFSSDCFDCFHSCFDCLFFKKCKFCVHSSECDRRNTDKSCFFDEPLIKVLFLQEKLQEKAFDLTEEDDLLF